MILSKDVPLPALSFCWAGAGHARALCPCAVRLEPGGGAAVVVEARPHIRTGVPGAVPTAHAGTARVRMAARREPDGPAAGTSRLRLGDEELLRRHAPPSGVPQGRPVRRLPDRSGETRPCTPTEPPGGRSLGTQGRLGAVPMEPRRSRGEVVPGDMRPGGPLAHRVRRDPRPGRRPGDRAGCRRRPGRGRQRGAVDRRTAGLSRGSVRAGNGAWSCSSAGSPGPSADRSAACRCDWPSPS